MSDERRRYEILATIGKGGFGTVYQARLLGEGDFTKKVALKVLNPDMEGVEHIASRLRDEARMLGLIRHRAVVHVDGLVKLSNRWTVVMEYIDGLDLKGILRANGKFPPGVALEIAGEIAGALHVAFATEGDDGRPLKVLHRDIKPANIQVTEAGEVKVLDFGVARADFDTREAETKSVRFGSMGYLSQERMDGIDTPAGDVYALGVVLWEMLAGRKFGQTYANPDRHTEEIGTKMQQLAKKGVDDTDVHELLKGMLAYEPDDRPAAREVERSCAQLRGKVGGPLLRDWAEDVLPALVAMQRADMEDDDLTGKVLVEGSQTIVTGAGLDEPTEKRAPVIDPTADTVELSAAVKAAKNLSDDLPPDDTTEETPADGPSMAMVAGIVIGVALLIAAVGAAGILVGRYL